MNEPNWAQMAYGYRAAVEQEEEEHRHTGTSNRPSAAKVAHAYYQGVVAGYEAALCDLKGAITAAEHNQAVEELLSLIGLNR